MKMNAGLKILLLTVGTVLVIALAVLLIYFAGDRTPNYETVDTAYRPVSETPMPTPDTALSESMPTPEPTPEPEAETPAETEETAETTETAEQSPEMDEDGFYPCDDTVTVTGDSVNVRAEPNTDCEVLGSVTRGAGLHRTGFNEENWCRIDYNGRTAYISGDYVSVDG